MKYLNSLREGMHISEVYLCKNRQIQLTKGGKEYISLVLQDKTGTVDGKVWDPASPGIADFDSADYVAVDADVTIFNNSYQLNIKRIRKADEGEYTASDYLPVSEYDIGEMYAEILQYANSVKNKDLKSLLKAFFEEDGEFIARFKFSSAAKSVHHGFVGGLAEHTLSVTRMCDYMTKQYRFLNRDLLITVALLHDAAKTLELTPFPENDYSDAGQLIGHIVMGCEMVDEKLTALPDFDKKLALQVKHCILAHHGQYEYGSPKKPAMAEALALHMADDTDAKLEIMKEFLDTDSNKGEWLGMNKLLDSNIRKTNVE